MNKFFLYLFCCAFLSNCTMSGTAFLGPAFTGVKTGSVYQSSLSFSSNKVINHIKTKEKTKNFYSRNKLKKINPILPDIPFVTKNPRIVLVYKVDEIEFSEVREPEPLP